MKKRRRQWRVRAKRYRERNPENREARRQAQNQMKKRRRQWRARAKRYRERNPVTYLFSNHKSNARRRGKVVLWDLAEFIDWCGFTGHHILAADGNEIHRFGDVGPYCASNCMSLPGGFNKRLEAGFRWRRKWLAEREYYLQRLKQNQPAA